MTYSEKVIEAIQNGDLEIVDENLQLALDLDDEETLYLLGNSLLQLGFLEETKRVYNHLVDVNPGDDELKIYLAEIEIEEGNELEALDLLHTIDETSDSYPQSLLVQADYYHLKELPEVSIQKLQEAEELLPEEPVVKFALAEVFFTIADHQNAIIYYENLLEEGIEEVAGTILNARLGNAYLMIGDYKQAEENLNKALTYEDDPEVYYQLGFVYVNQEEYHKAVDALNQAKASDPSLIAVYLLLAEAYEQLQQLKEGLKAIEEGISVSEVNIELYLKASELATKLDDYELADNYYKEAVELEPENERTILSYAEYLDYTGNYDEVIALFEEAPNTVQVLPKAMWLLALANNELEEYEKARTFFDQAYPYLEDQLDFLKDYALFLREDGQREKMREVIEKYLELSPEFDQEMASLLEDDDFL